MWLNLGILILTTLRIAHWEPVWRGKAKTQCIWIISERIFNCLTAILIVSGSERHSISLRRSPSLLRANRWGNAQNIPQPEPIDEYSYLLGDSKIMCFICCDHTIDESLDDLDRWLAPILNPRYSGYGNSVVLYDPWHGPK